MELANNNLPEQLRIIMDGVFKELMAAKPAWRNGFKTKDEVVNFKKSLSLSLYENGINTQEKINFGLKEARKDDNPFMPSTGEFIKWCEKGLAIFAKEKRLSAKNELEKKNAVLAIENESLSSIDVGKLIIESRKNGGNIDQETRARLHNELLARHKREGKIVQPSYPRIGCNAYNCSNLGTLAGIGSSNYYCKDHFNQ